MRNHLMCAGVLASAIAAGAIVIAAPAAAAQARGWTLGEDAEAKKSPLPDEEKTIAAGRAVYKDKCQRCHGPGGLGDGPDADPDAVDMDLTNPKRAARHPDGVVYYKVLNGRGRPKMPAFKDELSEQQIWSVVAYVQTLRKK